MARTEIKPLKSINDLAKRMAEKPKMDPIAVDDAVEEIKAEFPVASRIATESIPRKPRGK